MTHCLRSFCFPVLLCIGLTASAVQAQIGFTLPHINNATPNQQITMPVTVLNFDTILSIQYVIRWDPAVLDFQDVSGFNLPNLDIDRFGLTDVDTGILRLVWWHQGSGVTLADNTPIFNIKFQVIGANNTSTPVYFTEITPNTFFEVVNGANQAFGLNDALLDNGFVAVGFAVGATEPLPAEQLSVYAAPNPVGPSTELWIQSAEAAEAECILTDASGRVIFSKKLSLSPGKNGMEIASYLSGQRGIWYLTVRTPGAVRVLTLTSI